LIGIGTIIWNQKLSSEFNHKISAVVCVRNEEKQIGECLEKIVASNPDEVILVDGGSDDRTLDIGEFYADKVIKSGASNLTRDRQLGIDQATHDFIAMIDADHRIAPGSIQSLLQDLIDNDFDIVQAQLVGYPPQSFWNKCEEETWELFHNKPGPRKMIGTAPCIYRKSVFSKAKFDDVITTGMDDTDFIYRLSKNPEIKYGIGKTKIAQHHDYGLVTYIHKFIWYGVGDGQFFRKHPQRAASMVFHLLFRYPLIYVFQSLLQGKWRASIFCFIQGFVRFIGLIRYLVLTLFRIERPVR